MRKKKFKIKGILSSVFVACTGVFAATSLTSCDSLRSYSKGDSKQVVVEFDPNGGSSIPNQVVKKGTSFDLNVTPTREAVNDGTNIITYQFAGWYTDAALTQPLDTTKGLKGKTTLYAKWIEIVTPIVKEKEVFTVAFKTNGGSDVASVQVKEGEKLALPQAPVKENYTFVNWYTNSELTTLFDSNKEITGDITLYAKWEKSIEAIRKEKSDAFLANYDENNYTLTDDEYHNKTEFDNLVKEFDEAVSVCTNADDIDGVVASYKELFDSLEKNDAIIARALTAFTAQVTDYRKDDASVLDDATKKLISDEKAAQIEAINKESSIDAIRQKANAAEAKIDEIYTTYQKSLAESIETSKKSFDEYKSSALENVSYDSIKNEINGVVLFADEEALHTTAEVVALLNSAKAKIDFALEKNDAAKKLSADLKAEVEAISVNNKDLADELGKVSSKFDEALVVTTKEELTAKVEELTELVATEKEKVLNYEFTVTVANISKEFKVKYGNKLEEVINKFVDDSFVACLYTDEALTDSYSYETVYADKTLYAKLLDTAEDKGVVDVAAKLNVASDKLLTVSESKVVTVDNEELTVALDKITVLVDGVEYKNEVLEAGNYEVVVKYGDYTSHKYSVKVLQTATVVAPNAKTLAYTGEAQELVEAGSTTGGKLVYSVNGGEYSETIPTGKTVGTYVVSYKVVGDESFYGVEAETIEVVIDKAQITDFKAPTAKTLTYKDNEQKLVEAGSTKVGTLVYSVNGGEYSKNVPTGKTVGTYVVSYKIIGNESYYDVEAETIEVVIAKAKITGVEKPTAKALTYTGEAQELVEAGSTKVGTLVYSLNGEDYSESIPTGLAVGKYTVSYKVLGGESYNDTEAKTVKVTIAKAEITNVVAPTAKTLTYTGEAQELVEAGSTTAGTLVYSLNGKEYSESIPTGLAAGTYLVSYKVLGGESYNDTETKTVNVVIAKAQITNVVAPTAKTLSYTGEAQELVEAGSTVSTIVYSLDNVTFVEEIPTGLDANSYRVYYKALENDNYLESAVAYVDVTISPKALTATIAAIDKQEFTGKELTPEVKVYDGELLLDETSYDVEYKNNVNPGTATITITFKGNYAGTTTVDFEVFVTEESTYTVDSLTSEQIGLIVKAGARKFNVASGEKFAEVIANDTVTEEVTVTLTSDIALNNKIDVKSNLVLDLNGHTITCGSTITVTTAKGTVKQTYNSFTVIGSLTVKNGTIVRKLETPFSDLNIFVVNKNGELHTDNLTVDSNISTFVLANYGSLVEILNSNIKSGTYAIGTNASGIDPYGAPKQIIINNSTLDVYTYPGETGDCAALLINTPTEVIIEKSTLIGGRQVVINRCGTMTIKDSTLNNTCEFKDTGKYLISNWGTGNEVPAAYVVVGNRTTSSYKYPANCTLDNVDFVGEATFPYIYTYGNTETNNATLTVKNGVKVNGKASGLANMSLHENTILVLGEDIYEVKNLTAEQFVKLNELGLRNFDLSLRSFEVSTEKELTLLAEAGINEEVTVTLTSDLALDNKIDVKSNLVLDLNGHTINPIIDKNHKGEVFYVTSKLTVKNGTIVRKLDTPIHASNLFDVVGELHVDNLTVDSNVSTFVLANYGSLIEILNSNIKSETYGVGTNASGKAPYGAPEQIIIKDSTLEVYTYAGAKGDCSTLLINTPTTVKVEGSTLIGGRHAVINRCGTVTIKDSTLKNTREFKDTDKYLISNWGTGNEVPAAYVVVGNRTTSSYEYPAQCTLDGVTFEGGKGVPYVYSYGTEKYSATVIIKDVEVSELANMNLNANTILVLGEDTYKLNELDSKDFNVSNEFELMLCSYITSKEEVTAKLTNDMVLGNTINVNANLVLDLNGHTITSDSSIVYKNNARSFTVFGSLTVKNGKIVKENLDKNTWDSEIVKVYQNASIVLDKVTLESEKGDGLYILKDSNVLIKDSTINTNTWCIRTDGTLKDPYGAPKSVKVINSTLDASAEVGSDSGSAAILINVDTKLEVIDSTLKGTRQAIVVRDGEAVLTNTTLICTAEHPTKDKLMENSEWKTGIVIPSAYITVGNKQGTYPYPAKVTLDGVIFEGETTVPYIYSYGTDEYSSTVVIVDGEPSDLSNVSLHENTVLVLGEETYKLKDLTTKQAVKLYELGLRKIEVSAKFEVSNEEDLAIFVDGTFTEEVTVKLINDIALNNKIDVKSNLVLDLNGHTINPIIDENHNGGVFIVYSKLTVKNGSIVRKLDTPIHAGNLFTVNDGGELHTDNLTVDSNVSTFALANFGSLVEILNSNIKSETFAVGTNASGKAPYGAPEQIIIKDSTLEVYTYAGETGDCATLLINTPTTVKVEGSTLIGGRQVVINRCGTITIKDSTLNNTCEYPDATKYLNGNWGSGNEVPAAYLVVGNRSAKDYEYPANCTLDNVDFVGEATFPYIYTYGNTETNNATLTIKNGVKVNGEAKESFTASEAVIGQNTVLTGITVA